VHRLGGQAVSRAPVRVGPPAGAALPVPDDPPRTDGRQPAGQRHATHERESPRFGAGQMTGSVGPPRRRTAQRGGVGESQSDCRELHQQNRVALILESIGRQEAFLVGSVAYHFVQPCSDTGKDEI
jgi:hypothetical protein